MQAELVNDSDPMLNYVLLGETVSDGLFMWISLAVNSTATYTASPASELAADGGHAVEGGGSVGGGAGGGAMGNGTMPSGAAPSGTAPPSVVGTDVGSTSVIGTDVSSTSVIGTDVGSASVTATGMARLPLGMRTSANIVSFIVNGTSSSVTSAILTATFTSGGENRNVPGFGKLGSKKPKSGKEAAKKHGAKGQ